ncbi:disk-shape morphogenesis protein volactin [Alienimonas californiensis]|uniref:Competence protein A n=1 Tax=Alienimonas californiensis TaxID=2527989 RepID=A0A517P8I0_9PLAN|nr:hypothetical protein [Alienimonas californiensis]QDT15681.1 hypothetical protein CA12_17710 [Alienimonas californiensis]
MSTTTRPAATRPCLTVLDLGVHRFRSLRRSGGRTIGRSCRAAYGVLPDSPARRRLLEQVGLNFATTRAAEGEESELLLFGDAADEYAKLFGTPPLALLPDGKVPTDDPPARQIVAALIDSLLPDPVSDEEPVKVIFPGGEADREFLSRVIRLRGYEPQAVDPAEAFAAATMPATGFRGLALICGADRWELAAVLGGKVVARCVAEGGTTALDRRRAEDRVEVVYERDGEKYLDVDACRRTRETFAGTLLAPQGEEERAIAELHAAALGELFAEAARRFSGEPSLRHIHKSLPVFCGGGGGRIAGFAELVERELADAQFPLPLGPVTAVKADDYLTARGALILAELDNAAPVDAPLAAAA